jgi:hypothetical protein
MAWSAMVEEEVEEAASLFALLALGEPAAAMSPTMLEAWPTLPDMVEQEAMRCGEQWIRVEKFWKQEWESMGLGVHSGTHLYMHSRRQCNDTFPKKIIPFCFNHSHDPAAGLRSWKGSKFKIIWSPQHPREGTPGQWVNIY